MVDTGLRRSEVCALNWGDVDFASGLVRVIRGKGGKARSVFIGAKAKRALLGYRRTLRDVTEASPLFQTKSSRRYTSGGFLMLFRRLSRMFGIHVNPHKLRRTFTILSLRSGMNVLHLQALLGHSSLEMVNHYAQLVDDDLLEAHRMYSPVDNLDCLK
jgi:integrase